jgi:hypothetical protein
VPNRLLKDYGYRCTVCALDCYMAGCRLYIHKSSDFPTPASLEAFRTSLPEQGITSRFAEIACFTNWEKVLGKGLRSIMQETEASIQRFIEMRETDIEKFYFWQAVIVTCEAYKKVW